MPESATQADLITPDNAWRPGWVEPLAIVGMLCAMVLVVLGSILCFLVLLGTIAAMTQVPGEGVLMLPLAISYFLAFGVYSAHAGRAGCVVASAVFLVIYCVVAGIAEPSGALAVVGALIVPVGHALLYGGFRMCDAIGRVTTSEHWHAYHLKHGLCPRCRYDLRQLPEPRCPECGGAWSIEEDATSDDALPDAL